MGRDSRGSHSSQTNENKMDDKRQAALKAAEKELKNATGRLKAIFQSTGKVLDAVEALSNDYELCNDKTYRALVAVHFAVKHVIG